MSTQLLLQNTSENIAVSELPNMNVRELRNIVTKYKIGDPAFRSYSTKNELIKAIEEHFPNGKINLNLNLNTSPVEQPATIQSPEVASKDLLPGMFIPKIDESFVLSESIRSYLSALNRMSKKNSDIMNTLLVGPQGCGKTSVAYHYAAKINLPLLKMNCPLVREPRDWFGAKRADNGSVYWDKALFAEATARGNVVICLDEITRATPNVLNSLLPLLDWTRESYVEEAKEKLKVGPNTYFFATANIGSQFTGTFKLDSALADRFGAIIECGFLPENDEKLLLVQRTGVAESTAANLVKVANMVRKENNTSGKLTETISTRVLLDVAQLYNNLKEQAFLFTILPKFSNDGGKQSERAMVMGFIQAQFPGIKNVL